MSDYFHDYFQITAHCKDLDLLFNHQKTKEMSFPTRQDIPDSPVLRNSRVSYRFCESVKYLGVLVNNKLRFVEHARKIL